MVLRRRVGFFEGLKYRGGGPMLAWMLHRITGVSIVLFVSLHVLAGFLSQQVGSGLGDSLNIVYESWYFQVYILFCVIFHAINGLRIAVLDIWPQLVTYQREALWVEFFIFAPVYGLTVFILIQHGLIGF